MNQEGPSGSGEPIVSIVRHRRERRRKCSLTPLVGQRGFVFYGYPGETPEFLDHVRLARTGPPLTPSDADRPILLLDGTWRLVEAMESKYARVPSRSLPPLVTAYPRSSKSFVDPMEGLASVEALAAAFALTGRDPRPILATYRWRAVFLRENAAFFERWLSRADGLSEKSRTGYNVERLGVAPKKPPGRVTPQKLR